MNKDIKLIFQCAVVIGLLVFLLNQCAKAEGLEPIGIIEVAEDGSPIGITQHLYDQAISEIEQGNKDFGCYVLRDALLASHDLDDDFETYKTIWAIGTQACNWINNPSTVETSAPKQ